MIRKLFFIAIFVVPLLTFAWVIMWWNSTFYPSAGWSNDLHGTIYYLKRMGTDDSLQMFSIPAKGGKPQLVFKNQGQDNNNIINLTWNFEAQRIFFNRFIGKRYVRSSILPDGTDLKNSAPSSATFSDKSLFPKDITTEKGSLFFIPPSQERVLLFEYPDFMYDRTLMSGVTTPSWGPNNEFVIFTNWIFTSPSILIVPKSGDGATTLTSGQAAFWLK